MVLSPAPNPHRSGNNTASSNWTSRFAQASASRPSHKNRQIFLGFVLMGALTLQSGLVPRTEAQQISQSAQAQSAPVCSAPASENPNDKFTAATSASAESNSSTLGLLFPKLQWGPKKVSLLRKSEKVSVLRAPSKASAVPATTVQFSPPLSSSQNSSPQPVAPIIFSAPVEGEPTIGISAIVSGQARQGEVVLKPHLTVAKALAAIGISLTVLDRVVPDSSALARDGMTIRVDRITKTLEKRSVAIPAELRYEPTTALKAGAKQQIQSPRAGEMKISETVWRLNGKVTKRDFFSQHIARAPQHRVIALGVMSHLMPGAIRPHKRYKAAPTSRGGSWGDRLRAQQPNLPPANPDYFKPIRSIDVLATGYSAGPAGGSLGNWTATGVRCTYGAVAVDPRLIPLGSKLYIEGYGYGFACDTGGAIKGKHIDLAFNSARAAMNNGKRRTKVWILASER